MINGNNNFIRSPELNYPNKEFIVFLLLSNYRWETYGRSVKRHQNGFFLHRLSRVQKIDKKDSNDYPHPPTQAIIDRYY